MASCPKLFGLITLSRRVIHVVKIHCFAFGLNAASGCTYCFFEWTGWVELLFDGMQVMEGITDDPSEAGDGVTFRIEYGGASPSTTQGSLVSSRLKLHTRCVVSRLAHAKCGIYVSRIISLCYLLRG